MIVLRTTFSIANAAALAPCVAECVQSATALAARPEGDKPIAESLAEKLRGARSLTADKQDLINHPRQSDSQLRGEVVLAKATATYKKKTGGDPTKMDAGSQLKLSTPFFTTKPTAEGTGLGLSISYDIVTQEHGGTITVDSRAREFTEFTVRLPHPPQATETVATVGASA
jgi:hypothetical protein